MLFKHRAKEATTSKHILQFLPANAIFCGQEFLLYELQV